MFDENLKEQPLSQVLGRALLLILSSVILIAIYIRQALFFPRDSGACGGSEMVSQLVNRTGTGSVGVTPSAVFSVLQRDGHLGSAEPYTGLLYASPLD